MDERMDGCVERWIEMAECIELCVDVHLIEWKDLQMDEWLMDGGLDGFMNGWIGGWMDGWNYDLMDGWMYEGPRHSVTAQPPSEQHSRQSHQENGVNVL